MTWLARFSLVNRAVVALVTLLVLAFGLIATGALRQELLPTLDLPRLTVVSAYPGASPEVVEEQVTGPVEAAVDGLDGVAEVRSTSLGSSSSVVVELDYGTDVDEATTQAERALQNAELPEDVSPQVISGGTGSLPVLALAVSADLPADQLADALRNRVQPLLADLDGVADVALSGIEDPRITIDLDADAAAERGISPSAVAALLQANGVRVPAGELTPETTPLAVQVGEPITSAAQLADLYVVPGATAAAGAGGPAGRAAGEPVRLGDIATIAEAPAPASSYTRTNGEPSVGIRITKAEDANTVTVADEVREALPEVTDLLGGDSTAEVTVVFDQAPFIERSVEDLTTEGVLGLVFAVLVILGFLLSVRATLVTAVSIPLSVLIAMIVLYVGDHTLNILTLGALTVAIGRVVDDSIVVIENIKRHIGYGGPRRAAILTAVREVAGAITASTITTVAVFAPIGLVGGQVGELFRPFAITVTAALLGSLLVSLTVVPVLASLVLRTPAEPEPEPEPGVEPPRTRLQRSYLPLLTASIARPVVSLIVAVGIFAGTVALVPLLETDFIGDAGGDTLTVSQELPAGTALPAADEAAKQVEAVLADTGDVRSYQVTVGTPDASTRAFAPPGSRGGQATRFTLTLTEDADAGAVTEDLRERLGDLDAAAVGELSVEPGQGGLGNDRLAVDVTAEDPAVLAEAADLVAQAVAGIEGASDVGNDLAAAQDLVDVRVDRRAAAEIGLSEAQVGQAVAAALRGSTVGALTLDGVEQDVVLRTGTAPADLAALAALPVTGPGGQRELREVAAVQVVPTVPTISRTDGVRSAQITARPDADDLGRVGTDLQEALDDLNLPDGAEATIGGVSSEQQEAFTQLGIALLAAIAVVYLVMVVTFRSLLQPLLLLVSIPFAATGALGLLLATGTPLGVPALIGMLMLVGIVVTNAIVLIDLVNQYRRAGRPLREAVVEGAAQRLRPIVMTAVATIFALLPMAFGLTGGGGFISQPLAVVVIGGLVSSTVLTLVLVPVLYVLTGRFTEPAGPDDDGDTRPAPDAAPDAAAPVAERIGAAAPAGPVEPRSEPRSEPLPELQPGAQPAPRPEPAPVGAGVGGRVSDRGGVPLPGAAITVVDDDGTQVGETISGPDGAYRVPLPGPGQYLLAVRHEDREPTARWLTATAPGPNGIDLGKSGAGANGSVPAPARHAAVEPLTVDVVAEGPAGVEGRIRSATGQPSPALVAVVARGGRVLARSRADAAGRYRLVHVPAGRQLLLVAPSTGPSASRSVEVPPTGTVRADLDLPPSGELTGVVRSGHGHGLGDVVATVSDADGAVVATVRTAADGSFRLAGLPEGSYTVTATAGAPAIASVRVGTDGVTSTELELGEPDQRPRHAGNGHPR